MKKWIIGVSALALIGCKQKNEIPDLADISVKTEENLQLKSQIEQLKFENRNKDSVLNEAFSFFNDIQDNLAKISLKNDEIRIKSNNAELGQDGRTWILEQIQNINSLREQNAKKVRQLQSKLKNKDLEIAEMQNMVDRLVLQIQDKDEQIESLQNQLADLDAEYSELFDEYQEQVDLALDVMKELNTVYYAFGTDDELEENNVIVKKGGFVGIGSKDGLSDDMNQSYFTKSDKTKLKEITIVGSKPKLVTDHPSSSYEWKENKLIITDANKFWKVSSYLVVVVK